MSNPFPTSLFHVIIFNPFKQIGRSYTVRAFNAMTALADVFTNRHEPIKVYEQVKVELAKVCLRCHHPNCPHCGDWCDNLEGFGEFKDEFCCGGECVYGEDIAKGIQSLVRWLHSSPWIFP